jgi:hypothetical protein
MVGRLCGKSHKPKETNMRVRLALCGAVLCVCLPPILSAQNALVSHWDCSKSSDAHSIDVGDQANHTYAVSKGPCTASKSDVGGVKEKEGIGTQFAETMGGAMTWHGVFVVTAENGDKIYYTYANLGKGIVKDGQFQSGKNKWSMVGGTGKFAAAKGEGTCTGKGNGDGTASWDCKGTYTLK